MSHGKPYERPKTVFDLSLPVSGPLSREDYFAERPPVAGLPPCRRLALGCAGLGGCRGERDPEESIEVLHTAWREGFRMTDAARNYRDGEKILGQAARCWSGDPPVISTKFGHPDFSVAELASQWAESRRMLDPARISLVALHDVHGCPPELWGEALAYLRERVSEGSVIGGGIAGGDPDVVIEAMKDGGLGYVMTYNRLNAITLQALTDVVPEARRHGVAIFAASPVVMGMLGSNHEQMVNDPQAGYLAAIAGRARSVKALADEIALPLSQLALRMLLSMPQVDVVVAGASRRETWADCQRAYEAGPLPPDVYERVWHIAQQGTEPFCGH